MDRWSLVFELEGMGVDLPVKDRSSIADVLGLQLLQHWLLRQDDSQGSGQQIAKPPPAQRSGEYRRDKAQLGNACR